jgi:hypothetical protein
MAVNITWSATQNGVAITSLDHGSGSNGDTVSNGGNGTAGVEVWLRHDGANAITNAGFYLGQKSGTYTGAVSAAADLAEMLAWGDGATAGAFGGFQINMEKTGGTPYSSGNWPSVGTKTPTLGSAFYTGVGDSIANKVLLKTSMGASVSGTGVLDAGGTACAFKCRVQIPTDEDTVGIRQFDQKLRYTYTS